MIANPDRFYISPADYLAGEQVSPIKHEYRRGQVYAMVGAKQPHVLLASNFTRLLGNHLANCPCLVMASGIKLQLDTVDCYYYSDVVITCDARDLAENGDFIKFPKLIIEIIEILSNSTAAFDRGEKFSDYQTCPTLEEYLLVSQTKRSIEVRSLLNSAWVTATYQGKDDAILQSINWDRIIQAILQEIAATKYPTIS